MKKLAIAILRDLALAVLFGAADELGHEAGRRVADRYRQPEPAHTPEETAE